uniref:High mobility group protein HMG-I/HMG-Y n=1 Tax=Steinernema glaseri TaxID=37863 RepID=A0A1I7ZE03_9BILA
MSAEKLSGGENARRRKRPSEKTSGGENVRRRKCPVEKMSGNPFQAPSGPSYKEP